VGAVRLGADKHNFKLPDDFAHREIDGLWIGAVVVSAIALLWSIWQSKREQGDMSQ
jgi:hypothetical protein